METIKIEAEKREMLSRGKLNAMRTEGWIPVVLYGSDKKASSKPGSASIPLRIWKKSFFKSLGTHKGSNVIIDLHWGKESANTVIKEVQKDVVTEQLLHIDFHKIVLTEKLEVMIPIHFTGEAPGVKLSGGILEHIARELKIICLPKDIPSDVKVDITKLEIGQGISVKDLGSMPNVTILSDPNQLIVNIVAPTILEEVAPADVPVSTEPEVILKGKKPEEGKEGEAPAATPQDKGGKPPPSKTPPSK